MLTYKDKADADTNRRMQSPAVVVFIRRPPGP
jgi:hypothetical protein